MIDNLIKYIKDEEYLVSFFDNKIHIFNYKNINKLNQNNINIKLKDKEIEIIGNDFLITKLQKKELLITGTIKKIEFR